MEEEQMHVRSRGLLSVAGAVVLVGVTIVAAALVGGHDRGELPTGHSFVPYPVGDGGSSHVIGGGTQTLGLQVLTLKRCEAPVVVTRVELVSAKGPTLLGVVLPLPTDRSTSIWPSAASPRPSTTGCRWLPSDRP
jgi:hypothetical protein